MYIFLKKNRSYRQIHNNMSLFEKVKRKRIKKKIKIAEKKCWEALANETRIIREMDLKIITGIDNSINNFWYVTKGV